jgi:hypothetical protein
MQQSSFHSKDIGDFIVVQDHPYLKISKNSAFSFITLKVTDIDTNLSCEEVPIMIDIGLCRENVKWTEIPVGSMVNSNHEFYMKCDRLIMMGMSTYGIRCPSFDSRHQICDNYKLIVGS